MDKPESNEPTLVKVHYTELRFWQRCILSLQNATYIDGYYYLVKRSVDKTKK